MITWVYEYSKIVHGWLQPVSKNKFDKGCPQRMWIFISYSLSNPESLHIFKFRRSQFAVTEFLDGTIWEMMTISIS